MNISEENGDNSHFGVSKSAVTERMQKRDETRRIELEEMKEDRLKKKESSRESVEIFLATFNQEKQSIEKALKTSETIDKLAASVHFESISKSLQQLQKYVTDSSLFLPSYDLRQAQSTIESLQSALANMMDKVIPKKKFAFKSRKKEGAASGNGVAGTTFETKAEVGRRSVDCGFADKTDQTLVMSEDEVNGKDVDLVRLKLCTVHLLGNPSAMHVSTLERCLVICGPVRGSIFIDNCKHCTFVLAAQQIRIHTTSCTNFYVHVTSKAIIEDSSNLMFSKYNLHYSNLASHFEQSGLDQSTNNWNNVDDFNWLAHDAKSPNWDILDEKEEKSFTV